MEVRFPECAKGRHADCPGLDVNHKRRLECDCICHIAKIVEQEAPEVAEVGPEK